MLYDQQVIGWGSAISDAEQPKHELYRDVAEKLRELARQSQLPDIHGDLRELAARFERMAVYYEAQRTNATAHANLDKDQQEGALGPTTPPVSARTAPPQIRQGDSRSPDQSRMSQSGKGLGAVCAALYRRSKQILMTFAIRCATVVPSMLMVSFDLNEHGDRQAEWMRLRSC